MVENLLGESLGLGIGKILAEPLRIETDLIHSDKTDR